MMAIMTPNAMKSCKKVKVPYRKVPRKLNENLGKIILNTASEAVGIRKRNPQNIIVCIIPVAV
jgi:hypothetical protein